MTTTHYIYNHIGVEGTPEDIADFVSKVGAKELGYEEFAGEEIPGWETSSFVDGVFMNIQRSEESVSEQVETMGEAFPNISLYLDWTEEHGSFRGYLYMEKGKYAGADILFNDYICPTCCDIDEDCDCVHEPLVFTDYDGSEAPF